MWLSAANKGKKLLFPPFFSVSGRLPFWFLDIVILINISLTYTKVVKEREKVNPFCVVFI